jgi:hypothetical protein
MTFKSKKVFLKEGAAWPEIAPELGDLLVRAFNMAEQWSEEDLGTSGRFDWGAYYRPRQR